MKRLLWLLVGLPLAAAGCRLDEGGRGSALGTDRRPNACTLLDVTLPVFGPAEFGRGTGKPATETDAFTVPERGELCLLVENGVSAPPHGRRISSAWLSVDGELVIGPEAFSQVIGAVSAPHAVSLRGSRNFW